MKIVGITDYTNQTPPRISDRSNYYAMFENNEMKTVGFTDTTNQTPSYHLDGLMSKFNTPKN